MIYQTNKAMTTLLTKMTIGYKFELNVNNGIKIMAAKGRQILVTIENDLYTIHAFTLRGVNMTNEVKMTGVFADKLQESIIESAKF